MQTKQRQKRDPEVLVVLRSSKDAPQRHASANKREVNHILAIYTTTEISLWETKLNKISRQGVKHKAEDGGGKKGEEYKNENVDLVSKMCEPECQRRVAAAQREGGDGLCVLRIGCV